MIIATILCIFIVYLLAGALVLAFVDIGGQYEKVATEKRFDKIALLLWPYTAWRLIKRNLK